MKTGWPDPFDEWPEDPDEQEKVVVRFRRFLDRMNGDEPPEPPSSFPRCLP